MNTELIIVLSLLVASVVMFVINKPRMDAVALLMMVLLPFTGVITMGEALAGFSDANIVLIAALFVIGEGLVRTGVAQRLGDWLTKTAGASETRLLVLLMLAVGILGSVMSSTGVIAIFIPVALRIAQSTGMAASRLMMPMSMAALISGMMTLVGTAPNLVVNSELTRQGADGFQFFSFTPFGAPILALGILYMLFARRWLSSKTTGESKASHRPSLRDWVEEYKLANREHRVRVTSASSLVGQTIGEVEMRSTSGASIVAIERTTRNERLLRSSTQNHQPIRLHRPAGRRYSFRGRVRAQGVGWRGSAEVCSGGAPAQWRLLYRSFAGNRHGGSHAWSEFESGRQDGRRIPVSHRAPPHGDRSPARQHGAGGEPAGGKAESRRHVASDRNLETHPRIEDGPLASGGPESAGRDG